jgi:HTH-type transcriptional regulator/antitoxin MqsA
MKKEFCPICGECSMRHRVQDLDYSYKGHTITLKQPGRFCDSCGEGILEAADLKATRQALASFKAETDGLLTPKEIRAIRKSLKLTQQAAAAYCGGGKNAFSRYESGELLVPRATSNLMRLLAEDKERVASLTREEHAA